MDLINWTKNHFASVGLEESRLAAEVLLAHVLKCQRIDLYTRFDSQPSAQQRDEFRSLVRRAADFEPVAYLVGFKEFYSLKFKVTHDVLIPRCETEMLVREAIDYLTDLGSPGVMWDVCTGSGCVAVATASQAAGLKVLATDISPQAVAIAAENAAAHDVAKRVRCRVADLLALPADCGDLAPFDVITANPPYVADGDQVAPTVKHEPKLALNAGVDGLDFIRPIVRGAGGFLKGGGALIMEFGYAHADAVRNMVAGCGEFREPRVLRDFQGVERAMVALKRN